MGSTNRRTILSERIAEILGTRASGARPDFRGEPGIVARKTVAYGSMMLLAFNPACVGAAGLGELAVQSKLGQPLNATVPVRVSAGESLSPSCVQPAPTVDGLRPPPDLRVMAPVIDGPGTYDVRVTTTSSLHEPMYELSLMIKCPGVSLLVRQYVLMLDLPGMPVDALDQVPAKMMADIPRANVVGAPPTGRATAAGQAIDSSRTLTPRRDGIPADSRYRVAYGDTLSTIAKRVNGRLPNTIWKVSDQIFRDNPGAFLHDDPNQLKLGALLRIPAPATLAAMSPGRSGTLFAGPPADAGNRGQAVVRGAPPPKRALATRNDSNPARRQPAAAVEPVTATAPVTSTMAADPRRTSAAAIAGSARQQQAPQRPASTAASVAQAQDSVPGVGASSEFYPFSDEPPQASDAPERATTGPNDAGTGDAAGTTTPSPDASATGPGSLFSILVGLLIGALLSLAVFGRQLLDAIGLRRRQRATVDHAAPVPVDRKRRAEATFDSSRAAAAFVTGESTPGDIAPLPISGPVEDTYIVETGATEPTIQDSEPDPQTEPTDALAIEPSSDDVFDAEDSAELAQLFDENNTAQTEMTAAMPAITEPVPTEVGAPGAVEADPTADMPRPSTANALEPTAEIAAVDENAFDPTAELPHGSDDEVFDPSGGLDEIEVSAVDSGMLNAFGGALEDFDPNEMFATVGYAADELDAAAVQATGASDPLEDIGPDDATIESDLGGLPRGGDEDEDLSETLQEALNLLESDFEEEFTASQILEKSALQRSLRGDLDESDDDAA